MSFQSEGDHHYTAHSEITQKEKGTRDAKKWVVTCQQGKNSWQEKELSETKLTNLEISCLMKNILLEKTRENQEEWGYSRYFLCPISFFTKVNIKIFVAETKRGYGNKTWNKY